MDLSHDDSLGEPVRSRTSQASKISIAEMTGVIKQLLNGHGPSMLILSNYGARKGHFAAYGVYIGRDRQKMRSYV
ncbi:MAG: hypothetical protein GF344_18445 [Chitinivibrionales bacterium]|nr:hypothetical protein [Chitinivibrionales bacterium]MBD3358633.1 hypothetical protein [Chitinivibrionales bacterium]